jgi:hypothetical protein
VQKNGGKPFDRVYDNSTLKILSERFPPLSPGFYAQRRNSLTLSAFASRCVPTVCLAVAAMPNDVEPVASQDIWGPMSHMLPPLPDGADSDDCSSRSPSQFSPSPAQQSDSHPQPALLKSVRTTVLLQVAVYLLQDSARCLSTARQLQMLCAIYWHGGLDTCSTAGYSSAFLAMGDMACRPDIFDRM